jgi:hypothetical protein
MQQVLKVQKTFGPCGVSSYDMLIRKVSANLGREDCIHQNKACNDIEG